jgi:hypothetical protein
MLNLHALELYVSKEIQTLVENDNILKAELQCINNDIENLRMGELNFAKSLKLVCKENERESIMQILNRHTNEIGDIQERLNAMKATLATDKFLLF